MYFFFFSFQRCCCCLIYLDFGQWNGNGLKYQKKKEKKYQKRLLYFVPVLFLLPTAVRSEIKSLERRMKLNVRERCVRLGYITADGSWGGRMVVPEEEGTKSNHNTCISNEKEILQLLD